MSIHKDTTWCITYIRTYSECACIVQEVSFVCSVPSVPVLSMVLLDSGGVSLATPLVCSQYSYKHSVYPS